MSAEPLVSRSKFFGRGCRNTPEGVYYWLSKHPAANTHPITVTPEQLARSEIDRQLQQAGWLVQSQQEMNIFSGLGVAVREFQLATGFADSIAESVNRNLEKNRFRSDCLLKCILQQAFEGKLVTQAANESTAEVQALVGKTK